MIGHSRWTNIKHKRAAADARRGKIWTCLVKEITVAARLGGGDANSSPRLRLAMDEAADASMPKGNINRAIQRSVGGLEGVNYEGIRYEDYGISGATVVVDCLTDNRTCTVAGVRHGFDRYGGNMDTSDSVAFLFNHVGQFIFAPGMPGDKLMGAALEVGANDIITHNDDSLEVICSPHDFAEVKTALEAAGFKAELAEAIIKSQTEVVLTGEDAIKMQKLLDVLENLDDVQEVFTSTVIGE